MAVNDTTAFSYLTPDHVMALLLQPLQQQSTFIAQGAPIVYQSSGVPVHVPQMATFGTPEWTAQGSAIAEIVGTQDEVTLLPSTVLKTASITRITRELMRQSIVSIDTQLANKMVADVAFRLDHSFYQGGGAPAPTGVFNSAYVQAAGTAIGTALSTANLYAADTLAASNNLNNETLKWLMHPSSWEKVRRLAGSDGQFYFQNSLAAGTPRQLLGHPVIVTTNVPDTAIALADFSKIAVAIDTNADVQILTERYAEYDEVGIKVTARADVAVLYDGAVVTLEGITP